jgi:DNA-binding transcriptional LysR family regulator
MEWQYLEYFRVTARLQHITRAAEELGMTQPALTRAIYRLERELGVPLFHHARRTTELTDFGRAFIPRVERVLKEFKEGQREFAELAGRAQTEALLGTLRSLATNHVPRLVRDFHAKHPEVRFNISQGRPIDLIKKLEVGEINIALIDAPAAGPNVQWRPVLNQELVIIVPPTHRLAGRESVRLNDLAGEVFVCYERGNSVREAVEALCLEAEFEPKIMFESAFTTNMRGLVAAGAGIALVPAMGSEWQLPTLHISGASACRPIGIAWCNDRSLSFSERAFRDFVVAASEVHH